MQRIDDKLWCLDSHFTVWGCRGSVRMTIIETSAGLLLYSPVHLTSEIKEQLRGIGRVATIVAPNLFHHLFLRECCSTFPDARVLVAKGLEAKIGNLPGAEEIDAQTIFDPSNELSHAAFVGHSLHEVVLFHRPTATLITADLLYNYGPRQYPAERAFFRSIGCYGSPKVAFYHRFAIRDAGSAREFLATVSAWPARRIIMSHGDIIESNDASRIFAAAWERIGVR